MILARASLISSLSATRTLFSVLPPTDAWLRFWQKRLDALDCQGLADGELAEVITAQGVDRLPDSLTSFLRIAGRSCGRLWLGSDSYYPRFLTLKESALSLAKEMGVDIPAFKEEAVVSLMHQGYVFLYLQSDGDDPPVMQFHEGYAEPEQIADSFSSFVESSLANIRSAD